MKFGAINVNGLDSETDMAVRDMLEARDFDVSNIKHKALNRNPNRPYEIFFNLSNNSWILDFWASNPIAIHILEPHDHKINFVFNILGWGRHIGILV